MTLVAYLSFYALVNHLLSKGYRLCRRPQETVTSMVKWCAAAFSDK